MAMNLRLGHIDSTFQPVFYALPLNKKSFEKTYESMIDEYNIGKDIGFQHKILQILLKRFSGGDEDGGRHGSANVDAGPDAPTEMMVSDASKHFNRPSLLRLQRDISTSSTSGTSGTSITSVKRQRDEVTTDREDSGRRAVQRVSVHPSLLVQLSKPLPPLPEKVTTNIGNMASQPTTSAPSQPPAAEVPPEDIGVFEEAGPVTGSVASEAVPAFTVPKPGLNKTTRKSGKGKGVVSSVLGADGSIRLEESRML